MFKIQNLSTKYVIKKLTQKDIPILLKLADGNPYYYKHYCNRSTYNYNI